MVVLFLSFSAPSTVVCTFRMHSQHVHLSPVLLSTSESKTLSSLIWVNWFSCCYSFFFFLIYFYIYLWLCWVFVSVRGLSLVAASGGHSSSRCAGLSLWWPLLLWSTGSRCAGSVVVAHGPSCSAACGIFPDQGSNPCPCIGRRILNHCVTREAPAATLIPYNPFPSQQPEESLKESTSGHVTTLLKTFQLLPSEFEIRFEFLTWPARHQWVSVSSSPSDITWLGAPCTPAQEPPFCSSSSLIWHLLHFCPSSLS